MSLAADEDCMSVLLHIIFEQLLLALRSLRIVAFAAIYCCRGEP